MTRTALEFMPFNGLPPAVIRNAGRSASDAMRTLKHGNETIEGKTFCCSIFAFATNTLGVPILVGKSIRVHDGKFYPDLEFDTNLKWHYYTGRALVYAL